MAAFCSHVVHIISFLKRISLHFASCHTIQNFSIQLVNGFDSMIDNIDKNSLEG